jgi:hypothetical protein
VIDVIGARLSTQRLVGGPSARKRGPGAVGVVRRFGALQAQDYPAAVWAIAQRTGADGTGVDRADIDADYQAGRLIRTHVLRPTWHLVAPDDLRWLLELTGPRVNRANGTMYRREGLDATTLARGEQLVVDALADGPLTRVQLSEALDRAGFPGATGLRGTYVLMAAELDRLICSAGFLGKQHGYARFEDRVPAAPALDRAVALRELAIRYYTGHGPATVSDFSWWSGLTLGDARAGIAAADDVLAHGEADGLDVWWVTGANDPATASDRLARRVHLLPNFDEYTVAYRDRENLKSALVDRPFEDRLNRHVVLVDGLVSGGWRNVNSPKEHVLEVRLATERSAEIAAGVQAAAEWYGRVNGVSVRVEYPS